ncbi:MFS transporter [Streptomyces sp. NPDC002104]
MVALDQTVVAVALDPMAHGLGLTTFMMHGVVLVYVLALAAFVPVGGMLARRTGRLTTFRAGAALFAVASALCALAPPGGGAEPYLLAVRAVQGVGGALMMPVATSVITDVYEERARGRALAVYAGLAQLFLVAGPIVGAVLTQLFGWRSVFLVNLPVGAACLWLIARARLSNPAGGGPLSVVQPLAVILSLVVLVLGLYQCGVWGFTDLRTLTALAVGAGATALTVRFILSSRHPLLDLRLLGVRPYAVAVALIFLVQGPQLIVLVHGTVYLRQTMGLPLLATGISLLPLVASSAAGTFLSGYLLDRCRSVRVPVLTGLTAATVGAVAWTAALPSRDYLWQVPGMLLAGTGMGLPVPALSAELMRAVPPDKRPDASVLRQSIRQLGGAAGLAAAGAVALAANEDSADAAGVVTVAATSAAFMVACCVLAVTLPLAVLALPRRARTDGRLKPGRRPGPPSP